MLEPARMIVSSPQRTTCSARNTCPPHVFNQLTNILAELVLEDLKQFPQLPVGPRVDRLDNRENTVLLIHEGGE